MHGVHNCIDEFDVDPVADVDRATGRTSSTISFSTRGRPTDLRR